MKINKSVLILVFGFLALLTPAAHAADEAEVRDVVQRVFNQLKSRDYNAVYDSLPESSRSRMSRTRFTNALSRAQNMYILDRMDVGQVRVSGNIAVVDTVLYGSVVNPIEAEGKIVVQQYVVREGGSWRVATGDTATVKQFLASNPAFARKFPVRPPRVYVKQGSNWIEFNPPRKLRS